MEKIQQLERRLEEKLDENQKLVKDIKSKELYIQDLQAKLIQLQTEKTQLEIKKKVQDDQITKLTYNLKEIEKELWKLKSIELNEQRQQNFYQTQSKSRLIIQEKSNNNNIIDIEGQSFGKNFKQPNNNNDENYSFLEYQIKQNKDLNRDNQILLFKLQNVDELSNQIKNSQNLINQNNEILQKIKRIVNNSNYTSVTLIQQELKNIVNQNETKDFFNRYFKCCDGQNELVLCKQRSCIYHLNCLYPKLIKQGQLALNNCDCGQPFTNSILRKVNSVESKCILDQILDRQLQKLISQMIQGKRFLLYKCPNLFCNFQWFFRMDKSSSNQGSLSYCPNCQINVYSEIQLN
ncbi:unnamed protein product [Paramecium primaurelia]|uniref:Uncharacterized protein n=1 Tax=Paramecium primaurelia TaxID=5886 RepID=A0A8S1MT80_PARPR|nr:unnamed protein product [Paramecium primaurelia]